MTAAIEADIDRMMQVSGVQRVPTPKLNIFAQRGFLDMDMCAKLIAKIDADRRPSTIADPNGDDYFRTSETCDLDMTDTLVAAAHTDYFEPSGADYARYCSVAGQRTWTFMIYLNETETGGATRFKAIKKSFQPETGKMLFWNNRREDGSINPSTIHHGMKVRKGVKYIITKWFREKPWG